MEYLVFAALGLFAGFVGGLFGVGGGVVVVPILIVVFGFKQFPVEWLTHMAIASSLAVMVATSITSALAHFRNQAIQFSLALFMTGGVLLGAYFGVLSAISLSGGILQVTFGLFLLAVGLKMTMGAVFKVKQQASINQLELTAAGALIGFISMLFGIGGGSMTVPYLTCRGLPSQKAVATSAALGVPIALFGAILYSFTTLPSSGLPENTFGYIYIPAVVGIALTSIPAAKYGANLAHRLKEAELKRYFGCFLMVVGLLMVLKQAIAV